VSTLPCRVCGEPFALDGPAGILVHIVALHTDTDEARWVIGQLSRPEDSDFDMHRLRAGERVG
jgi:hypothetical protein